jgi:hypothetical protein
MNAPISDDFACEECGGPVRCVGGTFRRGLDGAVIGIEEGYECDENDDHTGKVVYKGHDEGEVHRLAGVVER